MKMSVEIRFLRPINSERGFFTVGDCLFVNADCDYISDHDDLIRTIVDDIGNYIEGEDFEIVNEEKFWNDMDSMNNMVHSIDNDKCEKIREILRRYFECNDRDERNPQYDENYSAQNAIDDIHEIVGNI